MLQENAEGVVFAPSRSFVHASSAGNEYIFCVGKKVGRVKCLPFSPELKVFESGVKNKYLHKKKTHSSVEALPSPLPSIYQYRQHNQERIGKIRIKKKTPPGSVFSAIPGEMQSKTLHATNSHYSGVFLCHKRKKKSLFLPHATMRLGRGTQPAHLFPIGCRVMRTVTPMGITQFGRRLFAHTQ